MRQKSRQKVRQKIRQKIRIVATAFVMSPVELRLGVQRLEEAGFQVEIDSRCLRQAGLFAGNDWERAQALIEAFYDSDCDIVWMARGGYGGARLLPLLEHAARKRGLPERKKLLVGYSDSTAILGFAREKFGALTLHGPMPGLTGFCRIPEDSFRGLVRALRGEEEFQWVWQKTKLENWGAKPEGKSIEGQLVGGNLAVWSSLRGTPAAEKVRGKILFFEEVDEPLYRIDRDFQQVLASGGLQGVRALVLGTFENCRDVVGQGLWREPETEKELERMVWKPRDSDKKPLREAVPVEEGLREIFGEVGQRLGIPVWSGLPVGHGAAGQNPLPLGARYRITSAGHLELLRWV